MPATAVGLDRFRARPHIHFVDEQIIRTPSHARSCPARDLGATLLRSEEESDIWMAFMLFRETASRDSNHFGFYSPLWTGVLWPSLSGICRLSKSE